MLDLHWLRERIQDMIVICDVSHDATISHPSKWSIANLIKCSVAISVLSLTTQPTLPIIYHLLNSWVMFYATKLQKRLFFPAVYCTHNYCLFWIEVIPTLNSFQSQYLFLYILVPYFIIKIYYKMRIIYASFLMQNFRWLPQHCISIQFHHTINTPTSYQGCW